MIKNRFINENNSNGNYIIRIDIPLALSNMRVVKQKIYNTFGKDNICPLDIDDYECWYYSINTDINTITKFGAEYINAADCNIKDSESVIDAFYNKYDD